MNHEQFSKFLQWERGTRDTIDFKKIYVDMAGDILAGLMLSEIVFWYLPNKSGESKLRVVKKGNEWIACPRYEWWERTRMSPRQADTSIRKLVKLNLVVKKTYVYSGAPTLHLRINYDIFLQLWNAMIADPLPNPYEPKSRTFHQTVKSILPKSDMDLPESVKSITETTTETTKRVGAPAPEKADYSNPAFTERKIYYSAFEMAFLPDVQIKVRDTKANQQVAQFLHANGYQPLEVLSYVKQRIEAGKADYRFDFLQEDLPKERVRLLIEGKASESPYRPAAPTAIPTPELTPEQRADAIQRGREQRITAIKEAQTA